MSIINRIKNMIRAKRENAQEEEFDPVRLTAELEHELYNLQNTSHEHQGMKSQAAKNLSRVQGELKLRQDKLADFKKLSEAQEKEFQTIIKKEKDTTKHAELIKNFENRASGVLEEMVRLENQITQFAKQAESYQSQYDQIIARLRQIDKMINSSKDKISDFKLQVTTLEEQRKVAQMAKDFNPARLQEIEDKIQMASETLQAKTELADLSFEDNSLGDILDELEHQHNVKSLNK